MYFNESTSTVLNISEEIVSSYSCRDRPSTRLLVHFFFTWSVSVTLIFIPVLVALTVGELVWRADEIRSGNFDTNFPINDRRYSRLPDVRRRQLMKMIISEMMLILFYVSVAFLYRLMMNNNSICWMTFACWIIEASFFPYNIVTIVTECYLNLWEDYLLEDDPEPTILMAYISKGILFVVIRYAEMHPFSKFNDYKIQLLYQICP